MLWSLIFGALPGLAGKALDYLQAKHDREVAGFTGAAGVDLQAYKAFLEAATETNRMKLAQQSWWGAKVIIMIAGLPAAVHFGAVMLDSLCRGGCGLGVPKVPAPYDGYEWAIVQSFFLVMPAMPVVTALAAWLRRR